MPPQPPALKSPGGAKLFRGIHCYVARALWSDGGGCSAWRGFSIQRVQPVLRPLVLVHSLCPRSHAPSIKYSVYDRKQMITDHTPALVFDWSTRRGRDSKQREGVLRATTERAICLCSLGRGRVGVGGAGGGIRSFFFVIWRRCGFRPTVERIATTPDVLLLCVHCAPRADDVDVFRAMRDCTRLILMWSQLVCLYYGRIEYSIV